MTYDPSVLLRMNETFHIAAVLDADELRPINQTDTDVQVLCHLLAAIAPTRSTRSKANTN